MLQTHGKISGWYSQYDNKRKQNAIKKRMKKKKRERERDRDSEKMKNKETKQESKINV